MSIQGKGTSGNMALKHLKIFVATLFLLICSRGVLAKEWRGIVPLKSTRADVERLLGKPAVRFNRHEFAEERASVRYSEGPCEGLYQTLAKDNCKCMVAKDTVLSIYVTPEVRRSFSALKIDTSRYLRRPINLGPPIFTYSNIVEGIVYTVDETDDHIIDIEYLPSVADCESVIRNGAARRRNAWRGLLPLHSSKSDVERLLGSPKTRGSTHDHYDTEHETVSIKYSKGGCEARNGEWNVPDDTVLELLVTPKLSFLARHLNLDLSKYRVEKLPDLPETPNLPKVVNYINDVDGVTVSLQLTGGTEEVIRIAYGPSAKENNLQCPPRPKSVTLKRSTVSRRASSNRRLPQSRACPKNRFISI